MMCSKGRRKSFWNLKLASSPFSKNFMDSCLRESTAKIATSSLELQPTCTEIKHISGTSCCFFITFHISNHFLKSAAFQEQIVPSVRFTTEKQASRCSETSSPSSKKTIFPKIPFTTWFYHFTKLPFWGFFLHMPKTVCCYSVRSRASVRDVSLNTKSPERFPGNNLCLSVTEISLL